MPVVALTGGIGCGKSEACRIFTELGVPVVDLDKISHQLTSAGASLVQTIAQTFGDRYVTAEGAMDRALMRELVFSNVAARERLNAILHPAIYQQAIAQLKLNQSATYQILAIPLLEKEGVYRQYIQHVLVIDCEESIQIARVMQRSQLSAEEVKQIIHAQTARDERLKLADTVIVNNGNLQQLREEVIEFHENYINTCIVSKLN
ncbi:MAG TPA: dephospho-CoA kinase [Methylophilaceae bacterium]|nr:dephospho-CoA kinase [Methylophilaceae bacterium]